MITLQKCALAFSASLFFVITSCVEKPKEDRDKPEHEEREENDITKAPDGIITLEEAKELCENYETRRSRAILKFEMEQNPEKEFIPTQFIDFDLKTIKKYIKYVEKKARKAKVKPDSLRIYLGNYGKEGRDPNRNTVFVLPTASINGEHGGFYIDGDGNAKLIRNYWPENGDDNGQGLEQKSEASFLPSLNTLLYQDEDESFILNYGNGGPPPTGDF
ncbi:hypothetical protein MTsPCn9_30340 [Croceitalea sp. MTPC9]|uniref:hypothetical protein n=1 Tax=unclassified Croceitalea TaxID=2632280 RepID=UPI002B3C62DD|nr:hypothetical protein MTsPCn6_21310 [Croceitalea sp. MTPC6]GMN18094.1 hypothetical protein MTsPCn9_30340 [Croceitalea sp. MTPC9]